MSDLLVMLDGRDVGVVTYRNGRLSFTYAEAWRSSAAAYPLSLSMPLAAKEHPHRAIEPFLWGLLPDNEVVLARWAQRFHVSPRNVFALIREVGEDCAGAVQFLSPERRDAVVGPSAAPPAWLTESEVASRLRILRSDASAGRVPGDAGQFSLAGAQPKTALLFDGQRWGVPSGREPTTHILKPQAAELDGHAANEHLCLALARAMGLPAVQSDILQFEDVTAIVVTRYDRVAVADRASARAAVAAARTADGTIHAAQGAASGDLGSKMMAMRALAEANKAEKSARALAEFAKTTPIYRIHQEDACQALGVHPARKYQNEGGPGPKQIIDLMRAHQSPRDQDVATFIDALILNWLIGGTDAHAKNYSLLLGADGLIRLAPLYDIASVLAYPDRDPLRAKMAMKIGDQYGLASIGLPQWRKLSAAIGADEEALIHRIRAMAVELPDRLADEIRILTDTGVSHSVVDTLGAVLPGRAAVIAKA